MLKSAFVYGIAVPLLSLRALARNSLPSVSLCFAYLLRRYVFSFPPSSHRHLLGRWREAKANELVAQAATLPQVLKRCEDRCFAFPSQLVEDHLNLQQVQMDVVEDELASEDEVLQQVCELRRPTVPTQEHPASSYWVPRHAQVPTTSN